MGKRGPKPDPASVRTVPVQVYFHRDEIARIDALREPFGLERGGFIRQASLNALPRTVPPVNRDAWVELSRLAGNVNQIARAINMGKVESIEIDFAELSEQIAALRMSLIGDPVAVDDGGGHEAKNW